MLVRLMTKILTVLLIVNISDNYVHAIYCYGCADSTSNRPCQIELDAMTSQAQCFKTSSNVSAECVYRKSYVTDCPDDKPYCIIEVIESRGATNAFIRTCSDGKTFYIKDVDGLGKVKPDNQTNYGYKETGYLLKVTLCKEDFCNGPKFTTNGSVTQSYTLASVIIVFLTMTLIA